MANYDFAHDFDEHTLYISVTPTVRQDVLTPPTFTSVPIAERFETNFSLHLYWILLEATSQDGPRMTQTIRDQFRPVLSAVMVINF